jgi:translation elongation factor EF-4
LGYQDETVWLFDDPRTAASRNVVVLDQLEAIATDTLAFRYGDDITRKCKPLEKQKEGKKKLRQFGKIDIPQEAFIAALKVDS